MAALRASSMSAAIDAAGVEDQADVERRAFAVEPDLGRGAVGGEVAQLLLLALFEDVEVVLRQAGHRGAALVDHGDAEVDDLDAAAEGRLLRNGRQSGSEHDRRQAECGSEREVGAARYT